MRTVTNRPSFTRFAVFFLLALSALLFATATVGAIKAEYFDDLSADFSTSTLTAKTPTLLTGQQASYTLVISNTGRATDGVVVQATLPQGMTYDQGTLIAQANRGVVESDRQIATNQLSWEGYIEKGKSVTLTVSASVDKEVKDNVTLMHNVVVKSAESVVALDAATRVVGAPVAQLFIPMIAQPLKPIELSATRPQKVGDFYAWTVSWDADDYSDLVRFTLEESHDPTFESGVTRYMMQGRSRYVVHAASTDNVYYYRLAPHGKGQLSETIRVVGAYRDDFSAETNWQIRREDFDDTQNELSYTEEGYLNLWVRGRWDYMIASPLAPAPEPPYRIETRVKFAGPAIRNTYGIIFGGSWDGTPCETTKEPTAPVHESCLNNYYRSMMLYHTDDAKMKTSLKRMDGHNRKNSGFGTNVLQDWRDVRIGASANDWNTWVVEVHADGTVKVINDGRVVAEGVDPSYLDQPYWGFWASTDAYLGSDPLYDYVLVEPLE